MRILQVCISEEKGGMERFAVSLAGWLKDSGCTSGLLVQEKSWLASEAHAASGNSWRVFTVPFPALRPRIGYFCSPAALNSVRRLRRVFLEYEPDVIHVHGSMSLFHVAAAAVGLGFRPLLVNHKHRLPGRPRKDFMHRFLYSRFDAVVVPSEEAAGAIRRCYPVFASRVRVFPNAVDLWAYETSREEKLCHGEDDGVRKVIYVGRVCPDKGVERIVHLALEVARLAPSLPVRFLVVGPGRKEYLDSLRASVEASGVDVRFLGERRDVPSLLAGSHAFVSFTRAECCSLSIIEAMAAGLPILVADAPGVRHLLEAHPEALFHPQASMAVVASRLVKILEKPERVDYEMVVHDRRRYVERLIGFYRELFSSCGWKSAFRASAR